MTRPDPLEPRADTPGSAPDTAQDAVARDGRRGRSRWSDVLLGALTGAATAVLVLASLAGDEQEGMRMEPVDQVYWKVSDDGAQPATRTIESGLG